MCFTGKFKDSEKKFKGKFEIPNLSEENDTDEIDVSTMIFCQVEKLTVQLAKQGLAVKYLESTRLYRYCEHILHKTDF